MSTQDDRRQIHDALLSYCRGIDRLDPDAVLAAFHPGAELIDYRPEPMVIETFADRTLPALEKRYRATQHRMSNTTMSFAGSSALVETYILAYHVEPGDEVDTPDRLHTFNGRYIDRFERREDLWRIARRTLRADWSRVEIIDTTMGGSWVASGRGGSADPLYDPPST